MKRMTTIIASALMTTGLVSSAQAASRTAPDRTLIEQSYQVLQRRASDYGIESARSEFNVLRVSRDRIGHSHVRFEQIYKGIPVFGDQLITHFNGNGVLHTISGTYSPIVDLNVHARVTPGQALKLAMADFGGIVSEEPTVALYVLAQEIDEPALVYHMILKDLDSNEPRAWAYFIDAHSGRIVLDFNDLHTAPAQGTGNTLYSGSVEITTNSAAAGFNMVDPSRGNLETTDMNNGTGGNGVTYTDADNEWGNSTMSDRASAGADAHFGAEMTWDYYGTYGRNGIRGDGRGNLSRTHYGLVYVNAYWDDTCFCMTYGDGDGVQSDPLVTLDVAGHEMTHGLTSNTAGLIYTGQPGGLNESMSDVFGTAVEFFAESQGADTQGEYWIGEDCWTPGMPNDALRYMDDPRRDGISIDNANRYRPGMDVHYSSGVSNNVFYLASAGGVNRTSGTAVTPIGREKTEAIFYRALTEYMTPFTRWTQARDATESAAADLYGQAEVTGIGNAWAACGVN